MEEGDSRRSSEKDVVGQTDNVERYLNIKLYMDDTIYYIHGHLHSEPYAVHISMITHLYSKCIYVYMLTSM